MLRPGDSRALYGGTAVLLVVLGWWLQARLHDGTYNFSVLSETRKHTTLHSEQAFYLSFFFGTIRAKSPFHAFFDLVSDTESEHPHIINALSRFNIYPEYVLGLLHRCITVVVAVDPYTLVMHAIFALAGIQLAVMFLVGAYTTHTYLGGILTAAAFVFNLNETTRVYSNPLLRESFSLPFLWIQIGLVMWVLRQPKRVRLDPPTDYVVTGTDAKPSSGKGAKAVARARMAQRAKGKPSWLQRVRRVVEPCVRRYPELVVSTFFFMISWQFSQFVLFLQSAALLATHLLGYTPGVVLHDILVCTMTGAVLVSLAMFGNTMVLGSLFLVFAGSIIFLQYRGFIALEPALSAGKFAEDPAAKTNKRGRGGVGSYGGGICARFVGAAWRVVLVFACTLGVKLVLGLVATEDAHVFNLLKAKLGDYQDFDTAMYLCGSAYNPLPQWVWDNMMATSLLHRAVLVLAAILLHMVADFLRGSDHADPAIVFLFWQSVAFTLLGVAIMRLMLFFTPSYCILAALLASPHWLRRLTFTVTCQPPLRFRGPSRGPPWAREDAGALCRAAATIIGVLLVIGVCYLGQPVLSAKLEATQLDVQARQPTSAETDLLELLSWVNKNTRRDAVLVSSLALSSTLRIATGRKLAIHPHAEDAGMRMRYRSMYTMYGKLSEDAVYASIRPLQGDYLVIPFSSCDGKCTNGKGLDTVAALGVDTARQLATEYNDKLDAGAQLPVNNDEAWAPRHDQFCYLVTQEPLRHFQARFQNNLYLVLAIPK